MSHLDQDVRTLLLGLRERDQEKRQELLGRGELFTGYHPEMEAVHVENARALEAVLDLQGWPTGSQVGDDGVEAAWLVALHSIGAPRFQRRCLGRLGKAVECGEAPRALHATLVDRIRYNERRPQVYGTLLDWDAEGQMSPWEIEELEGLEERRCEVGLPPLERSLHEARERVRQEGGRAPQAHRERQEEILAWARRVGWVSD